MVQRLWPFAKRRLAGRLLFVISDIFYVLRRDESRGRLALGDRSKTKGRKTTTQAEVRFIPRC
jgi:hypothetical protein